MSEKNAIEIFTGDEAKGAVNGAELEKLVNALVSETHDRPKIVAHNTREQLRNVLLPRAKVSSWRRPIADKIYPGWTLEEDLHFTLRSTEQNLQAGCMVIAKIRGEVAGMAGIRFEGKMPDGSDVYMITRLDVLPEFLKSEYTMPLYSRLAQAAINLIPDTHSKVTAFTKNPAVKIACKRKGFIPMSLEEFADMQARGGVRKPSSPEDIAAVYTRNEEAISNASDEQRRKGRVEGVWEAFITDTGKLQTT
jgi:hypothetical protein